MKINVKNKAKRELLCQECNREYPVWYAENSLWNLLVQHDYNIQFLCPTCFANLIQKISKKKITWKLYIPDN